MANGKRPESALEGGELCADCRAFLLGDVTVDPAKDPWLPVAEAPVLDVPVTGSPSPAGPWRGQERSVTLLDEVVEQLIDEERELTAEEIDTVVGLVQDLAPTFVTVGEAARLVVQLVPSGLVELAAELDRACLEAQALGLDPDRCQAVVDEELERTRETLEELSTVTGRVRGRLYHEGGACACTSGTGRICEWAGRASVHPVWRREDPCA